jgi:hypothetical protein
MAIRSHDRIRPKPSFASSHAAHGRGVGEVAADHVQQPIASTLVWALTTAARIWHAEGYTRPLQVVLDEALEVVERGLRLDGHVGDDEATAAVAER